MYTRQAAAAAAAAAGAAAPPAAAAAAAAAARGAVPKAPAAAPGVSPPAAPPAVPAAAPEALEAPEAIAHHHLGAREGLERLDSRRARGRRTRTATRSLDVALYSQGSLAAVQAHLREHPEVQWVWYDYWCMPQKNSKDEDDRTPVEKAEFVSMLSCIADLYLTTRVLIILDNTYIGRFWTMTEA